MKAELARLAAELRLDGAARTSLHLAFGLAC